MIGRWAANEERTVGLLSSCEHDEFSPLLVTRTRRNIIRPVRKALGVTDARSDYESDTPASPTLRERSYSNHILVNPRPDLIQSDTPDSSPYTIEESAETDL